MDKQRAREYLIKSKLYRFFARAFACAGVLLFAYTYFQHSEGGNILTVLRDPFMVFFLFIPFAPAFVFSYMARRNEKKVTETMKEP